MDKTVGVDGEGPHDKLWSPHVLEAAAPQVPGKVSCLVRRGGEHSGLGASVGGFLCECKVSPAWCWCGLCQAACSNTGRTPDKRF